MAERIRVLRVIARTNVGGPALQVSGLARGLDPERFDHRILVGYVGDDEADYLDLRAPDVEVTRIAGLGRSPRPLDDLRALHRITAEMRSFRPHIVHTHTAKAGVLGRVAAIRTGVPLRVHTFHGHLLHGYFRPAVTRAVIATERALARRTTCLVAVGAHVRDELVATGIGRAEQYRVVPPGVDLPTPPSRAEARAALGIPRSAPVIAFVARMTAIKRPDRFAELANRVHGTRPDLHVVVAGDGAQLADLRAALRPLGSQAHFLGFRDDVERIYAAADVVALTSDNEGMPVSLIEAAWCGRPAVSTDVGSVREVVLDGRTGFVGSADVDELAALVARVLDDPELASTLSANARSHAEQQFSTARLVADTAAIYEELLAR